MTFRTEIEVTPFPFSLDHKSKVVLMGSCFTSNIGEKLEFSGFETLANPFGITFNPISLANQITQIVGKRTYSLKDLNKNQDQYFSFQHHSSFNNNDADLMLAKIISSIKEATEMLKTAQVLFISLGSAWVWERKENGQIVNNCHKVPLSEFNKKLLSYDEALASLQNITNALKGFTPNANVVFTVSPVRHWRHGAVENMHSKSILHSAVQNVVEMNQNVHYFPSYEIMMDDLRDYRFYADDMLHPSQKAINYIWEKFGDGFFSAHTKDAIALVNKVRTMQNHHIKSPTKTNLTKFNRKLMERISELKAVYDIELI
jgi:hypothetical protein